MYEQVEKPKENKSRAIAQNVAQKKRSERQDFGFVDNRSEAFAQRKLQAMAINSPRVSQLKTFQDMANNSPQARQAAQLQAMADNYSAQKQQTIQKKGNNTGLPDNLKTGIENLSGHSMDDVEVHYNSDKPAQLNAHAYAQGSEIHLASGQEKHLPHEAWHVVQQKQGRVKPTMQMKGKVNDDVGLEKEADVMGGKALRMKENSELTSLKQKETNPSIIQAKMGVEYETGIRAFDDTKAQAMIGKKIGEEKTFPPQAEWTLDNPKYKEIADLFAQYCYVGQDETMWNGAGW